jgi:hypothetical protein
MVRSFRCTTPTQSCRRRTEEGERASSFAHDPVAVPDTAIAV